MYYPIIYSVYKEISRVPQAQVTIRLQTSDVSQYTLYDTFIMFPNPAAIGTRQRDIDMRYRGTAW